MPVITKTALAAELGISKARVSQYCRDGMPVLPDGKLNRDDALNWIRNRVKSGHHEGKGADLVTEVLTRRRPARPPQLPAPAPAVRAVAPELDGFTPEARALLDVLNLDGPTLLDGVLLAYGVSPADRQKAVEAFMVVLGYVAAGLHEGDGDPWDEFCTAWPSGPDDPAVAAAVNSDIEEANASLYAAEEEPESLLGAALQAGRRARVPAPDPGGSR